MNSPKTYEVEIVRTMCVSITVEATSSEEAKNKAWSEFLCGRIEHEQWETSNITVEI